jgi:DinB superfamily
MNVTDMLEQSHLQVIQVLDDLPELAWDIPEACGDWSVKDIIAHLASYERVLIDALNTFSGAAPTPYLHKFLSDSAAFDAAEVEVRKYQTPQHIEDEYQELQVQSSALLASIPANTVWQTGTMPWSRTHRCLGDFIHTMCEHTREHCAQIVRFRATHSDVTGPAEV